MTSTRNSLQDFILTPQQQNLLFAALNSNRPSTKPTNFGLNHLSSLQFNRSPEQPADGMASFQSSPEFDYDYDFAGLDTGFDFLGDVNQPKMIGDLPGTQKESNSSSPDTTESPEKRSHPADEEENSGAKRRESEDKVAKKPGRKPLTTEPTSKRKAQNRAAQRAFRERKEKHLKDLENKVQELEKLSQATNNENEQLRAKIEKLTTELNEYKKRVSVLSSSRLAQRGPAGPFGNAFFNNMNDVNFMFEFPKFGSLPGPPVNSQPKKSSASTPVPAPTERQDSDQTSPTDKPLNGVNSRSSTRYDYVPLDSRKEDFSDITFDLTNPSLTGLGTNRSSYSLDSQANASASITTSSPSASSNSNMGGTNSSCGTSPEPFTQSPMGFKPVDTLDPIREDQALFTDSTHGLSQFGNAGLNDFSHWLPPDFEFNPQLLGDYREPQESVLSQRFDDNFFSDALDDFSLPFNAPIADPVAAKPNLIAQIDAAKEADETEISAANSVVDCQKIWERLENCPKVKSNDFDLDGLCRDLQKKAKCSGTPGSAVVCEKDFNEVLQKHLLKGDEAAAMANTATKQQQT